MKENLDTMVTRNGIIISGRLVNLKEANKQAESYVGGSLTVQVFCFMLIDYV